MQVPAGRERRAGSAVSAQASRAVRLRTGHRGATLPARLGRTLPGVYAGITCVRALEYGERARAQRVDDLPNAPA